LEHAHVSLDLEGISRNLTLEMNRHRPFNISQESTRYVNIEGNPSFVLEPYYADIYLRHEADPSAVTPEEWKLVSDFTEETLATVRSYKRQMALLEVLNPENLTGTELRKWARGKARNVLSGALNTAGVWTCNFRGWRNFIELRSGSGAEAEIRRLAQAVFEKLEPLAPTYFNDYSATKVKGYNEYTTEFTKV
jgi:thymidylate synthase (FAD)